MTTDKVRLRVVAAAASPVLAEFGLYLLPDLIEEPSIERDAQGMVTVRSNRRDVTLFYTVDGTQPSPLSQRYTAPFALPAGGVVRALAVRKESGARSAVAKREFDLPAKGWRVVSATGDQPRHLIEGRTFLGRANSPVSIVIDLGQSYDLQGFTLRPVVDHTITIATAEQMGPPARFTAWVSTDGRTWGAPAGSGEFANIAASRAAQRVRFDTPHPGRYLRLELPEAVQNKTIIGIGGIGVLTR